MNHSQTVDALIAFFEQLSPATVDRFADYYAADACFKDPFNDVCGLQPIQHIFAHMFTQLVEPRFVVLERVVDAHGALLVWELHYRIEGWWAKAGTQVIRGASHLQFNADGKVVRHRDYWDAAEELYAKLPGIGWLMRRLRRQLAA
jgi:steroid delta-isomerase